MWLLDTNVLFFGLFRKVCLTFSRHGMVDKSD